jgi:hypothetical protein
MQTDESDATVAPVYAPSLQPARPALEGRAAYWRKSAGLPQLEIGGAFHLASTHVAGLAIPSHIASLDWSFSPSPKIQWSGTFYKGQNVAALGSLGNGFLLYRSYARAIHTTAGWSQLAVPLTNRLTYRLFGGIEEDNGSFAIMRDFTFASNLTYRLAPNVLLGVEALQSRYRSYGGARPIVNRYDLALGYLF